MSQGLKIYNSNNIHGTLIVTSGFGLPLQSDNNLNNFKGSIRYNIITNVVEYSNGLVWIPISGVQNIGGGIPLINNSFSPQGIKSLVAGTNMSIIDSGTTLTLISSATGGITGSATTTDNTPTNILNFTIPDHSANFIKFEIIGVNVGTGQANGFNVEIVAKRNGLVVTIIPQSDFISFLEQNGIYLLFDVSSGSNIIVQIVSLNGNTINWIASGNINSVTF